MSKQSVEQYEGIDLMANDPVSNPNNFVTQNEFRSGISAVESQVQSVAQSVEGLAHAITQDRQIQERRDKELRESIEDQSRDWRNELRAERESRRTPPTLYIAAVALLLTIAGMSATLTVFAINGSVAPLRQALRYEIEGRNRIGDTLDDVRAWARSQEYERGRTDEQLRWHESFLTETVPERKYENGH